eukprot:1547840-Rhodomonas_salina.1
MHRLDVFLLLYRPDDAREFLRVRSMVPMASYIDVDNGSRVVYHDQLESELAAAKEARDAAAEPRPAHNLNAKERDNDDDDNDDDNSSSSNRKNKAAASAMRQREQSARVCAALRSYLKVAEFLVLVNEKGFLNAAEQVLVAGCQAARKENAPVEMVELVGP